MAQHEQAPVPGAEVVQSMSIDELKGLVRMLTAKDAGYGITGRFIADKAGYTPARLTQWLGADDVTGTSWATFEMALRSALEGILAARFRAGNTTARKFRRMDTSVAKLFFEAARSCQQRQMLGLFTGPAGRGKTTAASMYAASSPDVVLVTASRLMSNVNALIREIAETLDVKSRSTFGLKKAICEKLVNRKGLIIIDEADKIPVPWLDALREFPDAGVGMLFVGLEGFHRALRQYRKAEEGEYLVDRFRYRDWVSDLSIVDVSILASSELRTPGLDSALLKACGGSARILETLVFHLRDQELAGEELTDKAVAETADSIRIF